MGAEATGLRDNRLPPPPPARSPPVGPKRKVRALPSARPLPSPLSRPSLPAWELRVPCRRATPSRANFWQSALRSRTEGFPGADCLTSPGPKSPARAARRSSWGGGGGAAAAIPAHPGAREGARAAPPCPCAPVPLRRPRAHVDPGRAPRAAFAPPPARPQQPSVRARVLRPKLEKFGAVSGEAEGAAGQGRCSLPGLRVRASTGGPMACKAQQQCLGGISGAGQRGRSGILGDWAVQARRLACTPGSPAHTSVTCSRQRSRSTKFDLPQGRGSRLQGFTFQPTRLPHLQIGLPTSLVQRRPELA